MTHLLLPRNLFESLLYLILLESNCPGGGGVYVTVLALTHAIVSNNLPIDCAATMVYSYGYSLDRDGTCHLDQPSDLSGVEPFLGPLQNNGGPTETHALPETSPAVNAGNCSATVATTDQRGVYRPQGGECDMGAYEYTWPFVYLPIILRP